MRNIGLIIEQVIDACTQFELLAEPPGQAGVNREVLGLEPIGIAAHQPEKVGIRPGCITPAERSLDRPSNPISNAAIGPPFRNTGELYPFGRGIGCILDRLRIDPRQVCIDIQTINQNVFGLDHQLGAVLAHLIDILVVGDDRAELIETAKAEDGVLGVLVEQADWSAPSPYGTAG